MRTHIPPQSYQNTWESSKNVEFEFYLLLKASATDALRDPSFFNKLSYIVGSAFATSFASSDSKSSFTSLFREGPSCARGVRRFLLDMVKNDFILWGLGVTESGCLNRLVQHGGGQNTLSNQNLEGEQLEQGKRRRNGVGGAAEVGIRWREALFPVFYKVSVNLASKIQNCAYCLD